MRKYALLAAAAGLAVSGSLARADFVFTTTRTTDATGTFAGDDRVTLTVAQTGTGTAQTGTLISFNLTESSTASSPKFFIRTMNLSAINGTSGSPPAWASAGPNTNADFADQGEQDDLGGTSRPGNPGSALRLGAGTNTLVGSVSVLSTNPAESGTFADTQSVPTFNVQAGEGGTNGINPGIGGRTLGVAVVPAGQPVTFAGIVSSFGGTAKDLQINITNPAVPEPASFSLLGIGAAGLLARRRRQA